MDKYAYDGPVMSFNVCIQPRWKASTYAESLEKAQNNLKYRYKKENGMAPNANISLPLGLLKFPEKR
jgi:hypothetical protein